MSPTLRRLAVTILVPLLVILGGHFVELPGVQIDAASADRTHFSVFMLGVTPILTAFWVVEVIAFLVPRWSRLRHVPEGRARLDRAARLLALVLAAVQAFGVDRQLEAIEVGRLPPMPLVVVTLVGGVCVTFVAARIVTRQGLVNGLALFFALGAWGDLRTLGVRIARVVANDPLWPDPVANAPSPLLALLVGVPAIAFATWVVLGRPSGAPRPARTTSADGESVYRGAQTLIVHPWIPLPAGSLQPVAAAYALLSLPPLLLGASALDATRATAGVVPTLIVLVAVLTWIAARLMNRPRELSDLALRLGANAGDVPHALRAALPTTYLFLLVVCLGGSATALGFTKIPLLAAVVMDALHAARIARRRSSYGVVWEERRASAVPVLRAALAEIGIASEVRGLSFLSLFQVFVPYAPAEILVAEADAPRATKALRHWLVGDEAPAPVPHDGAKLSFLDAKRPWPTRRRNIALAASAAVLFLVLGSPHLFAPPRPPKEAHVLEVVRVDDATDVFRGIDDTYGVEIRSEDLPSGKTAFARATRLQDETIVDTRRRLQAFLRKVHVPAGERFGVEDVEELDEDTDRSRVVAVRSFLLTGESILRNADVDDAAATVDRQTGRPYVAVILFPGGATRFADATGEWAKRRIAIVVDDVILSAPVVSQRIGGGHISITMGMGDRTAALAEAKALANSLRP